MLFLKKRKKEEGRKRKEKKRRKEKRLEPCSGRGPGPAASHAGWGLLPRACPVPHLINSGHLAWAGCIPLSCMQLPACKLPRPQGGMLPSDHTEWGWEVFGALEEGKGDGQRPGCADHDPGTAVSLVQPEVVSEGISRMPLTRAYLLKSKQRSGGTSSDT